MILHGAKCPDIGLLHISKSGLVFSAMFERGNVD